MLAMLPTRVLKPLVKLNTPRLARIIESMVILRQPIHPREILVFQLALQRTIILSNPLLMAALRDHARAPPHAPHQRDLRRRTVPLRSNSSDDLVLEQLRRITRRIRRIRPRERRVPRHMDAVLLVPRDPVALLQVRVQFHLVHGGRVRGVVEEGLQLRGREVRDADVPGFAFAHELDHRVPGFEEFDFVVAEGRVGYRPVHVVEIEVGELEVGEGGGEAGGDVFGAVAGWLLVDCFYEKMRRGCITGRSTVCW